jgi:hypothetical protein
VAYIDTRGDWSQQKQRRGQMFRDQFGRSFFSETELKTGDQVGNYEPQFSSPLAIPKMYIERGKDPNRPYDIFINTERWKADIRAERREWEKEGRQRSMKLYGEKYRASDPFTAEVLEIIGPPPMAIEPVQALEQRNSWVLGKTTIPDLRLVKYFEPEALPASALPPEPDFTDLEELYDPDATGGQRVPARRGRSAGAGKAVVDEREPSVEEVDAGLAAMDRPRRSHHKKHDPEPEPASP